MTQGALAEAWFSIGEKAFHADPPDRPSAAHAYREAIRSLPATGSARTTAERHLLGSAWLQLGNVLCHGDTPDLDAGLRSYREASAVLSPLAASGDPTVVADAAAASANRGHALLRRARAEDLAEAETAFAEGIAMLRRLFPTRESRFVHNLAGMLFNLAQAQRARRHPGALVTLEEALRIACQLPPSHVQGQALRISILLNLGNAHWDLARALGPALAAFDQALAELDAARLEPRSARNLRATIWANRAHLLAEHGDCPEDAGTRARDLVDEHVESDAVAAELSLLARRAQLIGAGRRLHALDSAGSDLTAAGNAFGVEIGAALALVARWHGRHPGAFREFQHRFFRLGLDLYSALLPGELPPFIRSHLAPDPTLRNWARESLEGSLPGLIAQGSLEPDHPRAETLLRTAQRLEAALAEIG